MKDLRISENIIIPYSEGFKYLGVIIDSKLLWNKHIEMVTEKARAKLWICMTFVRDKWGAQPKIMHWMYTAIVRPPISYSSIAWWNKTEEVTVQKKKLNSVQRIECVMITNAFRSTETSAMETLLSCIYSLRRKQK